PGCPPGGGAPRPGLRSRPAVPRPTRRAQATRQAGHSPHPRPGRQAPPGRPGSWSGSHPAPPLPAPDEELTGMAGDLPLAVAEPESRQIARVLPPDAEVRVDLDRRE